MNKKVDKIKTNWPVMVLLILGLSTIIFPLYMAIVIAFKQPSEMTNSISGILSLPAKWSLSNFAQAMEVTDFWRSLGNSVLITVVTVVLSIVLHSMLGYAIGRNPRPQQILQICIPFRCERHVRTLRHSDDAPGKTDSGAGTRKLGWRYHPVCGIPICL